jgi:CRP/FNR family cyclic AMP-dependent transcriptional regulator
MSALQSIPAGHPLRASGGRLPTGDLRQDRRASLLCLDPDLGNHLDPEEREAARAGAYLRVVDVPVGPFDLDEVIANGLQPFGAMVVSGLVMRETGLIGQPALRLFGPGEIFCDELDSVEPKGRWAVAAETRLAILDDHLLLAIRRWPRLVRALFGRLQQGHEATLLQLAISHQPRVEERVMALMRMLATRWGRVTPDGVVLRLALTHEAIGRMIGARRPTVSLALGALREKGLLVRQKDGGWLLDEALLEPTDFKPLSPTQRPTTIPG